MLPENVLEMEETSLLFPNMENENIYLSIIDIVNHHLYLEHG